MSEQPEVILNSGHQFRRNIIQKIKFVVKDMLYIKLILCYFVTPSNVLLCLQIFVMLANVKFSSTKEAFSAFLLLLLHPMLYC